MAREGWSSSFSPKDFGGGQRAQQGETKQRIKVCDCQCREKLNNPVTSMKVNSRSAAHREYQCLQDNECSSGVRPAMVGSLLPRDLKEAGGGHALPTPWQGAAAQGLPPGMGGGAAQWFDNVLTSNPCRDAFVSTSSQHSHQPKPHINRGPLTGHLLHARPNALFKPLSKTCRYDGHCSPLLPTLFCDHFIEI